MAAATTFFYSIVALLLSAKSLQVSAASCCLRANPMDRLRDGLDLQIDLLINRDQEFMFLPNADALVSYSQGFNEGFQIVESLLKLLQQRYSLSLMNETSTILVLRELMNAVISDSCNYLSEILKKKIDCYSQVELQALASRFELYRSILTLDDELTFIRIGTPKNRYAYWDESVEKSCTLYTCPRLQEIKRRIMRFVRLADVCLCS